MELVGVVPEVGAGGVHGVQLREVQIVRPGPRHRLYRGRGGPRRRRVPVVVGGVSPTCPSEALYPDPRLPPRTVSSLGYATSPSLTPEVPTRGFKFRVDVGTLGIQSRVWVNEYPVTVSIIVRSRLR